MVVPFQSVTVGLPAPVAKRLTGDWSKRHELLILRDGVRWQWFNVLVFGLYQRDMDQDEQLASTLGSSTRSQGGIRSASVPQLSLAGSELDSPPKAEALEQLVSVRKDPLKERIDARLDEKRTFRQDLMEREAAIRLVQRMKTIAEFYARNVPETAPHGAWTKKLGSSQANVGLYFQVYTGERAGLADGMPPLVPAPHLHLVDLGEKLPAFDVQAPRCIPVEDVLAALHSEADALTAKLRELRDGLQQDQLYRGLYSLYHEPIREPLLRASQKSSWRARLQTLNKGPPKKGHPQKGHP